MTFFSARQFQLGALFGGSETGVYSRRVVSVYTKVSREHAWAMQEPQSRPVCPHGLACTKSRGARCAVLRMKAHSSTQP